MYTLVTSSKFFFMEFAEELQKQNKLDKLVIGYPRFKLRNYGINKNRVSTFPFLHVILMKLNSVIEFLPLPLQNWLSIIDVKTITVFAKIFSSKETTFVAMSGMAREIFKSSDFSERRKVVLFRASRHIVEQDKILRKAEKEWEISLKKPALRMIHREISEYEQADLIIVPSEICAESFYRNGINQDKVKVIYFPHSLSSYAYDSHKLRNRKKVTFVGNVSAQKGIITLLKAWKLIDNNELTLTIIGKTDHKFMEYLKSRDLIFSTVNFTGHLNHKEIRLHLAQTSLFVMPSIQEGWPMAVMEAISMQCVTLISDAICKFEELPNHDMNFMFESGNHFQLAAMISELTSEDKQKNLDVLRSRLANYPERTWTNFVNEFTELVETFYQNEKH